MSSIVLSSLGNQFTQYVFTLVRLSVIDVIAASITAVINTTLSYFLGRINKAGTLCMDLQHQPKQHLFVYVLANYIGHISWFSSHVYADILYIFILSSTIYLFHVGAVLHYNDRGQQY